MLKTIIKYCYYFLVVAVPFAVYSKTSELFEFNKMMVVYAVAGVVSALWLGWRIQEGKMVIRVTTYFWVLLAFLAVLLISTFQSIDQHVSIYGYYGRLNGGVISIAAFMALAFVFVQVASREFTQKLVSIMAITSGVVVLWGLSGTFGFDFTCALFVGKFTSSCWSSQFQPMERMFATLGQPNWLGSYLSASVFFAATLSYINRKNSYRILYGSVTALNIIGVYLTKSRSSYVALAIAVVVFIGLLVLRKISFTIKPKHLMFLLAAFIIMASYGTYWVVFQPKPQIAPTAKPQTVTDSFTIRTVVWKGAFELVKRYPVFGTGPETFGYAYYLTRPAEHNYTSEWDFLYNKAHNEFINYLATTGIIGLAAYFAVILWGFWLLFSLYLRRETFESQIFYAGMIASLVAIHITNAVGFSTSTVQLYFYLIPVLALFYGISDNEIKKQENLLFPMPILQGYKTIGLITTIVLACGAVLWVIVYINADMRYAQANTMYSQGNYDAALTIYEEAERWKHDPLYQDKIAIDLGSMSLYAASDKSEYLGDIIRIASRFNEVTRQNSPQNVLYLKTQAKINFLFFQSTKDEKYMIISVEALKNAMRLSPTDPKLPYTLALYFSINSQNEKSDSKVNSNMREALYWNKKALNLKANYTEAQELMQVLNAPVLPKNEGQFSD